MRVAEFFLPDKPEEEEVFPQFLRRFTHEELNTIDIISFACSDIFIRFVFLKLHSVNKLIFFH